MNYGRRELSTIHMRGVCGVCVVCVVCVCCMCAVCVVCVVCVWCMCGVCVVYVWCMCGVCVVCMWCVCGVRKHYAVAGLIACGAANTFDTAGQGGAEGVLSRQMLA